MIKATVTSIVHKKDGFRLLVIKKCPFCGCKHTHGGGPIGDDIHLWGGSRVSHCWKVPSKLYELVIPEGVDYEYR